MTDNITFNDKSYPVLEINVPTYGMRTISVESLENALIKNDGFVNDEAKHIDENIFFYVPDRIFNKYTPEQLSTYVDINISIPDEHPYNAEGEWVNSDDMQRCRMLIPGIYELIEANEDNKIDSDEPKFVISESKVIDIDNHMTDGKYDDETISIIKSYYGTVENFENNYPDQTSREQVLAEMIYEQTSCLFYDYGIFDEATTQKILDFYCENNKLPNEEEIKNL